MNGKATVEIHAHLDDWHGILVSTFETWSELQGYLDTVYEDGYDVTSVRWDGRLARRDLTEPGTGQWVYPRSNIEATSVPSTYTGPTNDNYANNE